MRARPGTARIAGIDIPIEESLLETAAGSSSLVPAAEPGQLYPARAPEALRPPARLSKDERAQISGYKGVRDRIWDGPLFTVLGGVEGGKVGRARKEEIGGVVILDPFENGVETYSAKYVVGKRRLPRLEGGRCGEFSFFSPFSIHF